MLVEVLVGWERAVLKPAARAVSNVYIFLPPYLHLSWVNHEGEDCADLCCPFSSVLVPLCCRVSEYSRGRHTPTVRTICEQVQKRSRVSAMSSLPCFHLLSPSPFDQANTTDTVAEGFKLF